MNNNQILTASFLDILFDGRNKEYGAYELRQSYSKRVRLALTTAIVVAGGIVSTVAFAGKSESGNIDRQEPETIVVRVIEDDLPVEPPPPPPPPPPAAPPVERTIQYTTPVLVDEEIETPPPPIDEIDRSRIDLQTRDGVDPDNFVRPPADQPAGQIIEGPRKRDDGDDIFTDVSAQAEFPGGISRWLKFLERNCNGQVASDNGAPEGRYTVVIRFVVDELGNVSNLVAMTQHGYGMEEEALRVIKKAGKEKWIPALQNGRKVKAYRSQPIVFDVKAEY